MFRFKNSFHIRGNGCTYGTQLYRRVLNTQMAVCVADSWPADVIKFYSTRITVHSTSRNGKIFQDLQLLPSHGRSVRKRVVYFIFMKLIKYLDVLDTVYPSLTKLSPTFINITFTVLTIDTPVHIRYFRSLTSHSLYLPSESHIVYWYTLLAFLF